MNEGTVYSVFPIGKVRQTGEFDFALEIDAPYREALFRLEEFSHVMVLWWADELDDEDARSLTQVELPYAPGVTAGMFACRGPARPNPIMLTTCELLGVDEGSGIVRIPFIDAMDGSPVLDLKPYIAISDRVREASYPAWLSDWPEWMEDAADFYAEKGPEFFGG